jgi:hypothetical protein
MLASIEYNIVDCDENLAPDELAAFRMPPIKHLWETSADLSCLRAAFGATHLIFEVFHDRPQDSFIGLDIRPDQIRLLLSKLLVLFQRFLHLHAGGLRDAMNVVRGCGDFLCRRGIIGHDRRRSFRVCRYAVVIWSVWFQVLMRKRGDSWLCAAELRTRVGVPRYTSPACLSPRLRIRRDNVRCINYIYSFGERVVRLYNTRRTLRLA